MKSRLRYLLVGPNQHARSYVDGGSGVELRECSWSSLVTAAVEGQKVSHSQN